MTFTAEQFDTLFGSPTKLARKLGEKVSTVGCWKTRGRIPYDKVIEVERVTGVARHRIRPDLYPDPLSEEKARV